MRIFKFKKPKFLLGLPVALFSVEIYLGALAGYFLSKYLSAREVGEKNRWWKSVVFGVGNYRLHLHHWLYSLAILILGLYYNFLPFPQLSYGFLGGVVFQGIISYPDWYRILIRRK